MLKLKAEPRAVFGQKLKTSRLAGQLPVVMYGPKDPASHYFVATGEFKKVFRQGGESAVVTLETPAGKKETLIQDVNWHPVNGEPIHADFYVIDKTKTIRVDVPLNFIGVAPAVKDLGGTLVKVIHELEIEVLPLAIPHGIEVDISSLVALDSQILVKDLVLPKDVKVINEAEAVVAAISVAKEEEVAPAEPVDLSAIEVEKKGKKEEVDGGGAAAPADEAK